MPKITIYEHGDFLSQEDDVRTTRKFADVAAKANATAAKFALYNLLQRAVLELHELHGT